MELCYVTVAIGVALEGYIYIGKKSRSDVAFINTDEAIRRHYVDCLLKLAFRPRVYGKRISVHSLELAGRLMHDIYIGGTKKLPDAAYRYPNYSLMWAFTLDGGVVLGTSAKNREIVFRSTSPVIQGQILKLLEVVLGKRPGVRGNGLIFIKEKEMIRKFRDSVGFLPGSRAVRGKHKGLEKNYLLDLLFS